MKKAITIITIAAFGLLTSKNFLHRTDASIYTATITGNATLPGTDVLYDGLISPGHSPGKITVTGDFTMGSGATYKAEIQNPSLAAGVGYDQIDISGDLTLGGTLEIVLDGYTPAAAHFFEIMAFGGTLIGTTFSTINNMPGGWNIDYGVLRPNKVTIYGPSAVLPVELLNFKVANRAKKLILSWQTASEQNSAYFSIEHSRDGKNFSEIGQEESRGTSTQVTDYSFTHEGASKGINYYRLKQVDLDGTFTYSKIISAVLEKGALAFYPNPATQTITFDADVEKVIIYDLLGRAILRNEQPVSVLDVSGLIPGIYILEANNGEFKENLVIE